MTLDEFIRRELESSGKTLYTIDDVCRLTEKWIEMKKQTAPPFEGWVEIRQEATR